MNRYETSLNQRRSSTALDRMCIILLAMCPILQHYKGPFVNAAVSVLLLVLPVAVMKLLMKGRFSATDLGFAFPLVLYFFYKVMDHGTTVTELGQAVVFSILVISIACGCFDTKYFIRVITVISAVASICIILQYICYYVLHFHLQLVPTRLLLPRSSQWILLAQTGRASVTGRVSRFYRPSAFFLEPSHMFIYMFTPLLLLLLSKKFGRKERNLSLLLTTGMVFSTSGMGIMMAIGIWMVFLGKQGKDHAFTLANYFRPEVIIVLMALLIIVVVMFLRVPFFHNSIVRIIGSGDDYTNAISGRVSSGNRLLREMHGMQLLFGTGDSLAGIEFNMAGFHATMYQYGIIGVILSYIFYLQGIFRIKGTYFWLTLIILALSLFSSHTHSTMFMIYSTFVFVDGFRDRKAEEEEAYRARIGRQKERIELSQKSIVT